MGGEVLALAGKDVRLLIRDKGGAFVTFVFPLIYCIFFGLIFAARTGGVGEMVVVVVDEDGTDRSVAFAQRLDATDEFAVLRATRGEALNAVRRGQRVAYIVLTKGFGEASEQILLNRRPTIEVGVDPSRQAEAAMIRGLLTRCAFDTITSDFGNRQSTRRQLEAARKRLRADATVTPGRRSALERFFGELERVTTALATPGKSAENGVALTDGLAGWTPIDIVMDEVAGEHNRPHNSYEISFPQGIIWGVLGCCSSFGISLVIERTSGTLSRLRVAPIGRTTILAGKGLACFGSTVSLAVVLFVLGWLFFGVTPRSLGHLAISLVMIAVAFVGIMMFLSILGKTERSVSGIGWGVLLGMAMLGGGMVPRMFMPQWMQTLSHVSPVKWAILAMEGAVWRGLSTREMLLPWGILLFVGVLFFTIGIRGFAWTQER